MFFRPAIIEIAFDNRKFKDLRDPDECYRYVTGRIDENDPNPTYVLLDEVQLMKEFEDVLNGFLHLKNADVFVTGSNSKFLSTDILTQFRGRGDEIRMYPLTFGEFSSACSGSWDEVWEQYYTFGGLPYILTLSSVAKKRNIFNPFSRKSTCGIFSIGIKSGEIQNFGY